MTKTRHYGTPESVLSEITAEQQHQLRRRLTVESERPLTAAAVAQTGNVKSLKIPFRAKLLGDIDFYRRHLRTGLRRGFAVCVLAWTLLTAAMASSVQAASVPQPAPGSTWGTAQEVPGTAVLNTGGNAVINSVSCTSAGNCSAGGQYTDGSGYKQAFVVDETGGVWGVAQEVPGTAVLNTGGNAVINSVSCTSAGNCSAGGQYIGPYIGEPSSDSRRWRQAFVVDETGGVWGTAQQVPGIPMITTGVPSPDWITSVSCASAGNCSAVGQFEDNSNVLHVFVFDETGGMWGTAEEMAPNVGPSLSVSSVSCASAGNCSTGGQNAGDISHYAQAFVADETGGVWGTAQAVPGIVALDSDGQDNLVFSGESGVNSVSCPSAGSCSAVGQYRDSQDMGWRYHVFVADETGGVWGNAQEVPGTASLNTGANTDSSSVNISSVSCASAGNCSAGGKYTDGSGQVQAFVADETGGVWGNAQEVPGTASLNTGGNAMISSVSCASAGNCSAGGTYKDGSGQVQAFVVSEPAPLTVTTTSLSSLGASQYGQPVTFTATVTPTDGGGSVAFYADGSATAISGCDARSLAQASGSTYTATCTTPSLPAGSNAITAIYSGDSDYPGSSGSLAGGQTVNPAPLTVTASDGAMAYGGTPPGITPSYSGFANGDGPGSLTTPPTCSTTATSVSPAGTYPASCSGAADPNYAISYVTGAVTVAKAAQSINFLAPATGAAGTSATLFATGGGSGNPVTLTVDPASGAGVCSVSGTTVTYTAPGSCVIDANQAGNANYTAAPQVTQIITVIQAAPTLTTTAGPTVVVGSPLSDKATLSGGTNPTGTITFTLHDPASTLVYTDHVTVTGNGPYSTAAGDNPAGFTPTAAGTYTWAASYSGDSNNTTVTASAETQSAVYGFGGFTSPLSKSTLQKSGSTIPVKFPLTNAAGQPISATVAAALAAANDVKTTLSGPGITTVSAVCTWNSVNLLFQCNIKKPSGLVTGTAYQITVYENVTGTFVTAPAVSTATTPNPEIVYFK